MLSWKSSLRSRRLRTVIAVILLCSCWCRVSILVFLYLHETQTRQKEHTSHSHPESSQSLAACPQLYRLCHRLSCSFSFQGITLKANFCFISTSIHSASVPQNCLYFSNHLFPREEGYMRINLIQLVGNHSNREPHQASGEPYSRDCFFPEHMSKCVHLLSCLPVHPSQPSEQQNDENRN